MQIRYQYIPYGKTIIPDGKTIGVDRLTVECCAKTIKVVALTVRYDLKRGLYEVTFRHKLVIPRNEESHA